MKKNILFYIAILCAFCSCTDLDLSPLAQGTNENWYKNEKEITMAVNNLYSPGFWPYMSEDWTDDEIYRNTLTSFTAGTLTGQDGSIVGVWANAYKAIARANTILMHLENADESVLSEVSKNQLLGETLFMRACRYADLVARFGDVPFVTTVIDIDEAFEIGRTDKKTVIDAIYADFDKAIELLPSSTGSVQRASKGAALALKARAALYNEDWDIVVKATEECMKLGYELYPDYGKLFIPATHNTSESIFSLPRSIEDNYNKFFAAKSMSRNAGGWAGSVPTWDLLASYSCTDGLPIDESPLFDPSDPFKNRDPRCSATIVPFNTEFLGFTYAPHPDSVTVMNYETGKPQINNDNKVNSQYASFNALLWKKAVDDSWKRNGGRSAQDYIIMRYADVLLMYAEAKIELNQIDQSVLDAMNQVRARAYGVNVAETAAYPAITETNQQKLRRILRNERHVEFAREGLRYMDLIRWHLLEKAMNRKNYGILYPVKDLVDRVTSKGYWFWAMAPGIDEDGFADFSKMEAAGLINVLSQRLFNESQYLWPIPTKEILINKNIKQNPGY